MLLILQKTDNSHLSIKDKVCVMTMNPIACGHNSTCLLTPGNMKDVCGTDMALMNTFLSARGIEFTMVSAGFAHSEMVDIEGILWKFQFTNEYNALGEDYLPDIPVLDLPIKHPTREDKRLRIIQEEKIEQAQIIHESRGSWALHSKSDEGKEWVWKSKVYDKHKEYDGETLYKFDTGNSCSRLPPSILKSKAVMVACGICHTMVVTEDCNLWTYCDNKDGQLGTGGRETKTIPFLVIPYYFDNSKLLW